MSRLTQRAKDGTPYIDCGEMCADWHKCDKYECKKNIILEKLAHYEDLEDDVKSKEPPFNINDDVYSIPSETNYRLNILSNHPENNKICHQKVKTIVLVENGWYVTCDKDVEFGTGRILIDSSFGKTWFLTKEEAEKALREASKDCTNCRYYWQNTDTESECNGQNKPCHEFVETEKKNVSM